MTAELGGHLSRVYVRGDDVEDLKSCFGGLEEEQRIKRVRREIEKVRAAWADEGRFEELKTQVLRVIERKVELPEVQDQIRTIFSNYNDWADMDYNRSQSIDREISPAIALYCSDSGNTFLWRLFNRILRMDNPEQFELTATVALVEQLTIELYNLRLANIGDPRFANFQGVAYRGFPLHKSEEIDLFHSAWGQTDVKLRKFSVPLGFLSASVDPRVMREFASKDPGKDKVLWEIHVFGLDPRLLSRYRQRFPDSVVTSICALPVARASPFGEKEILLRGPFFQIIDMATESTSSEKIHRLTLVMLNSNRDHGREMASDEGRKGQQRMFFNNAVNASKFEACSGLALAKGRTHDAETYRILAKEALQKLDSIDKELTNLDIAESPLVLSRSDTDNLLSQRKDDAKAIFTFDVEFTESTSDTLTTWLGASSTKAYPVEYVKIRDRWHQAALNGKWDVLEGILRTEYDWRVADWFHLAPLYSESPKRGLTVLHEMALRGQPDVADETQAESWAYLVGLIRDLKIQRGVLSFDAHRQTPAELARQCGHADIAPIFEPLKFWHLVDDAVTDLQQQLEALMLREAGRHLEQYGFRFPQVALLLEQKEPRVWVPVPGMFGGFDIRLHDEQLIVKIFQTVCGSVEQTRRSIVLGSL